MESYFDLGSHSRRISTSSADAQLWFDRGLIWAFAFNHEEAVHCFEQALAADPHCAMAHWGVAYSIGPYYNKQWVRFDAADLGNTLSAAHAAMTRAVDCLDSATAPEQALINALRARYPQAQPVADMDAWNDAYADAMRGVYQQFPDDLDVCTLFADALMNRTPWALWDLASGAPADGADTLEAVAVIERGLAAMPPAAPHPGLLHVYIHLMEMSPYPERALRAADGLRELVPGAGHLLHMATHIDAQCGLYADVVRSNRAAARADKAYSNYAGEMNFHALSRAHNFHFMLYGAMFAGQYAAAEEAAQGLLSTIPEALLRVHSPPMADWLEGYVAMAVHAEIRFGHWREILALPLPQDRALYCTTTAMLHYARTLAHAVLGDVVAATAEREIFLSAVATVPASRMVFNNSCQDILAVARAMLEGELEYRKENFDTAFEHLRRAVQLSDEMPYDEPWGWMQPARHALGALLLEQGRVHEAEAEYRADLGLDDSLFRACRHLDNVWSLHGYHECLQRLGKSEEAQALAPRLAVALARADVPIKASCLCRVRTAA
jgi:tetratricopeptide (TPR) repeat protein